MQFELNQQVLDEQYQSYVQGLFLDTLMAYNQLNQRIEKIVVKMAIKEWTTETRKYAKKDTWWTNQQASNNEISDELYRPLQDLRVTLNYLYSILPQCDFLQVYRKTLQEIEDWYWKNIITQSQFSNTGALQLEVDLKQGLWKIGQRWVTKPENYMKRYLMQNTWNTTSYLIYIYIYIRSMLLDSRNQFSYLHYLSLMKKSILVIN
jgi:hypothetical protein